MHVSKNFFNGNNNSSMRHANFVASLFYFQILNKNYYAIAKRNRLTLHFET